MRGLHVYRTYGHEHLRRVPALLSVGSIALGLSLLSFPGRLTAQSYPPPPSPNISIASFGAVPNTGTDQTANIQAAVDAARTGSVKTVVFPPGEYMVRSVGISAGLTLWGYGATLKLLPMQPRWMRIFDTQTALDASPAYLYVGNVDSPTLTIRGFTFDGNRVNQGSYQNYELQWQAEIFLTADGFSNQHGHLVAELEDITFTEGAGDGVDVNQNVRVTMSNITASNLFREGIGVGRGWNIVKINGYTSSGTELTGFHIEGDPGAGPNVVTASNFNLQGNFTPGLKNGSTLIADHIVSGSPWEVSAINGSKMIIENSSLGGGVGLKNSNIIFPGNIQFNNVDFYADDLTEPLWGGMTLAVRVGTNTQQTSYTNQLLQFNDCRFHLPKSGKPTWPTAAIYEAGDQLARNNVMILNKSTIDPGFTYGIMGNMGGTWDVSNSDIAAEYALRLKYSVLNGVDYFWDVVVNNMTPQNYQIQYEDIQPFISNGVPAPQKIKTPIAGSSVTNSTLITFDGSAPQTPQCSVDGGTWAPCTSGVTTLSDLPGWSNITSGSFSLYVRDTTSNGQWGTDVMSGLNK